MAQIEIAEARAPFVMFETRAVEDRDATIANGRYTTKDVDFALITPAGSKDQVERVVSEWFEQLERDVKSNRTPRNWLMSYKHLYEEWKAGNETPVNGTPIKTWAILSPSQRTNLLSWKVMTVEDLAVANEEVIRRLGMGGRLLKQQAVDFLKASASDTGKVTLELTDLRQKLDDLLAQNRTLLEANANLQRQVAATAPETQPQRTEAPDIGDIIDGGFKSF